MITHISNQDLTKANDIFNELLQGKMDVALEQEKIAVASTIFNGTDEADEEQLELDLGDELDDVEEDEEDTEEDTEDEFDDEEIEDESE